MHAVLLGAFNDQHQATGTWNNFWDPNYINPDNSDDLRVLNVVICSLFFCGLMSIFLLISSKFSNLESDRSQIQIYKQMRKDYQAFKEKARMEDIDLMNLFKNKQLAVETEEERRLFNFLFSAKDAEYLKEDPTDCLLLSGNVNARDKTETLLTKALKMKTFSNREAVIGKLINRSNIDLNETDPSGMTPLLCAIEEEDTWSVEILLAQPNIEINKTSTFTYKNIKAQFSPLNLAIQKENVDIVSLLLKHEKIDVNLKGQFSALTKAIQLKNVSIVRLLLDHKNIDVNQVDANKTGVTGDRWVTPLYCTIEWEDISSVKILLAQPNIEVNKPSTITYKKIEYQFPPLHLAILKENADIVGLLLKHNDIDVNQQGQFTALTKAIYLKNERIVRLLLNHPKIDLNQVDMRGWTPLRQAYNRGDSDEYYDFLSCCRKSEEWPILNLLLRHRGYRGDLSNLARGQFRMNVRFEHDQCEIVEMEEESNQQVML